MNATTTTAHTVARTWRVDLYAGWGDGPSAAVHVGTHTVTLAGGRTASGDRLPLTAQVDGQPTTAAKAVGLLEWAKADGRVELLHEERTEYPEQPAAPVYLTRQRARKMHKVLAALGVATDDRYRLASQIAGRDVQSLTALTEAEARAVWLRARADQQARDQAAAAEYPAYH